MAMANTSVYTLLYYYYLVSVFVILLTMNINLVNGDFEEESCYSRKIKTSPKCYEYESYHPWPEKEECKNYQVQLAPYGTYKPTALSSFVCSGLTWLLQMVERSSGIATGNVQQTLPSLIPQTQIRCNRRFDDGTTIITGTHDTTYNMYPKWYADTVTYEGKNMSWPNLSKVHFNYHGILLIRNPWHALISARVYIQRILRKCSQCTRIARVNLEANDVNEKDFMKYMENGATQWVNSIKTWVNGSPHGPDMIIIRYEDLIKNPKVQGQRVLKYLNVSLNEGRLNCLIQDPVVYSEYLTYDAKSTIAKYFDKKTDMQSRNILEEGMIEINSLFKSKGIKEYLDYKIPTHSDILFNRDVTGTRRKIH